MVVPALVLICPAVLVGVMSAGMILYYVFPGKFIKLYMRMSMWRIGMRVKSISNGEWTFTYSERGKYNADQPTMLCFHGFSSNLEQWIPIAQKLPKENHIIALDLPGHGGTSRKPIGEDDVGFHTQASQAHIFSELKGLTKGKIHVIGASMGGTIAGIYASMYPDEVSMVTMMCPAMKSPIETDFLQELRDGTCRLIPKTVEEMHHMMHMCMYKKVDIPRQILRGLLENRLAYNEYFTYVFEQCATEENGELLIEEASKITSASHIIWGENDELFHLSGADYLKERLPNVEQVDIIKECGHTMNFDRPGCVTKALLTFRSKVLQN